MGGAPEEHSFARPVIMLSQNGLMLEVCDTASDDDAEDFTCDMGTLTALARHGPAQGARKRIIVRHAKTDAVGLRSEESLSAFPLKLFTRFEGAGFGIVGEKASDINSMLQNKLRVRNTYRGQRVWMHILVWLIALVNICMSVVLVWIWNFKPVDFAKNYTYLCELRYEQANEVTAAQPFKPTLVYRPALLFGSWVMMPYAGITVGAIYLLLRALVLYVASANFLRSLERNPQLSDDIWSDFDKIADTKSKYCTSSVEKRMFNTQESAKSKEDSMVTAKAEWRIFMLVQHYYELTEIILHMQYKHLKAITRETFYRAYLGLIFFVCAFSVWYYFRMIYDSDRFVNLQNNPIGYRSNFRMGLIQTTEAIDANKGAGFFGEMTGEVPMCIPKEGVDWDDVPLASTDYNIQGIAFPSNLVNLWTCCAVHFASAAIVASWAYGHVIAMGPKSDVTRRARFIDDELQEKLDFESEYANAERVIRENIDNDDWYEACVLAKVGVDWESINQYPTVTVANKEDGWKPLPPEDANAPSDPEVKAFMEAIRSPGETTSEAQSQDKSLDYAWLKSFVEQQGGNAMYGPMWRWSIPLVQGRESVQWGICGTLCGDLRRTWMSTIGMRLAWVLKQTFCARLCKPETVKTEMVHTQLVVNKKRRPDLSNERVWQQMKKYYADTTNRHAVA